MHWGASEEVQSAAAEQAQSAVPGFTDSLTIDDSESGYLHRRSRSAETLLDVGSVVIESLALDGALVLRVGPGCRLTVRCDPDTPLINASWELRALAPAVSSAPPPEAAVRVAAAYGSEAAVAALVGSTAGGTAVCQSEEVLRMRGYTLVRHAQRVVEVWGAGAEFILENERVLQVRPSSVLGADVLACCADSFDV